MVNLDLSLARLVTEHPECARVLQKHRLDFCCRGERTLRDACAERSLDPKNLLDELERVASASGPVADLRAMPTDALIDHIVARHHGYLREALPFVSALSTKVARVHGAHNPNLIELAAAVAELCTALEPHLEREEREVFPSLVAAQRDSAEITAALDEMTEEHRLVGDALQRMRAAAEDYSVPEWGCRSYGALFSELERLEADTLTHVHAENHVLASRFRLEGAG